MRLCLLALVLCPVIGFASSYSTPEGVLASQVATVFQIYRAEHGVLPKQWSDLKDIYDPDYPPVKDITKRYAILDVPLDIEKPYKVKLLALARKPLPKIDHGNGASWELSFGSPGRNLIVEDEKGNISRIWGNEKDITTAFQAGGRVLPEPDQEPEPFYITRARSKIHFWTAIKILLLGIVIWFFIPRIHRWVKWAPSPEDLDPKNWDDAVTRIIGKNPRASHGYIAPVFLALTPLSGSTLEKIGSSFDHRLGTLGALIGGIVPLALAIGFAISGIRQGNRIAWWTAATTLAAVALCVLVVLFPLFCLGL